MTIAGGRDEERRPLDTFLASDLKSPRQGLVLWIDDAHEHFEYGLTSSALRQLVERYPNIVLAITVHSHELDAAAKADETLERLLRRASEGLVLEVGLSTDERQQAQTLYPALADDEKLTWLPEWFAAVNLLRDKYFDNRGANPHGFALVKAAIDWRRTGMPPAIPVETLRRLGQHSLAEYAPQQVLDDLSFEAGLAWATEEVARRAALLQRTPGGDGPAAFQVFDAIVSASASAEEPVTEASWQFVVGQVSPTTGVGVAQRRLPL